MRQNQLYLLPILSSGGSEMVKGNIWHEIHSRFKLNESKKSIARNLNLDVRTVRKILSQPKPQKYQRREKKETLLTDHEDFIRTWGESLFQLDQWNLWKSIHNRYIQQKLWILGGDDGRQCDNHCNAGQVVTSCPGFHPGWRILQNKKSKQGGMIIFGSLRNGKSIYRKGGKYPYHATGKCPYRTSGKSTWHLHDFSPHPSSIMIGIPNSSPTIRHLSDTPQPVSKIIILRSRSVHNHLLINANAMKIIGINSSCCLLNDVFSIIKIGCFCPTHCLLDPSPQIIIHIGRIDCRAANPYKPVIVVPTKTCCSLIVNLPLLFQAEIPSLWRNWEC